MRFQRVCCFLPRVERHAESGIRHLLQNACQLVTVGILARRHPVPFADDNTRQAPKEVHEGLRPEIFHMRAHLRPFLPLVEGEVTVLSEEKMTVDLSLVDFLLHEALPGCQHLTPAAIAAPPT